MDASTPIQNPLIRKLESIFALSDAERSALLGLSSDSVVGQRMVISFGIELHDRLLDGVIESFRSHESLVRQVMALQIAPALFDVVEFGRILGQPFDRQPGRPFSERGTRCLAGMDRAIVENEHDRLAGRGGRGTITLIDLLQQRDEI